MNFRQVHLDFHTSEAIKGIGEKFEKEQFQKALTIGHVNSITLFSKCHHGWAYHPSTANEIHPHLSFDLLGAQIEAAHEIGVKTPVYLSAGLDEKMARRHPEWLVRNRDESTMWARDFSEAGYHKFCMNTPYLEYLAKQVEEVCENYDADGIFLDIVGVQPCYCQSCIAGRREQGLNPYDAKAAVEYAEEVYARYAARIRAAVDKYKPGLPLFHNGGHIRQGRRDIAGFNTHLELESLPTGGWGYDHFPFSARYCQGLGMEYLGMTGKFHTSWGEFGGFKHPNALRYEVALSAANGAKCSIGDQLAPNGKMDEVTYELIGRAYAELEEKEPWIEAVESVADVGVLSPEAYLGTLSTGQMTKTGVAGSGVSRILLEGKYLFDVIDFESRLDKYKVLVLPDVIRIDGAFEEKLKQFCADGGKVLATGKSALKAGKDEFCIDLGAEWESESPYHPSYFRPTVHMRGMGDTGYIMYGKGETVRCTGRELGRSETPYFNRTVEHFCSHKHAPCSGEYGGAGMAEGINGIYIAWDIFTDYAENGSLSAKQMVCFALDRLLGENKTLETNLQSMGVATLMKQEKRYVAHLLYAVPTKRGKNIEVIEDIYPVHDVSLSIRLPEKIRNVYLAPQMQSVDYEIKGGRVHVMIDAVDCHQMVVLEWEEA